MYLLPEYLLQVLSECERQAMMAQYAETENVEDGCAKMESATTVHDSGHESAGEDADSDGKLLEWAQKLGIAWVVDKKTHKADFDFLAAMSRADECQCQVQQQCSQVVLVCAHAVEYFFRSMLPHRAIWAFVNKIVTAVGACKRCWEHWE